MNRYKVDYEWELAGWDEFNRSRDESEIVVAESEESVKEKVLNKNKGRRIYIYNIINII